ncbi:MAG: phosphatidate cytidylyltransferase [Anaerolineales bacterium]|nr:phosphatidate cytidylyltransferase [Chloroflexota bacterium]MBL6981428.1 phosphatidate cytidylyltransferase [Anaerolineales bacterium]
MRQRVAVAIVLLPIGMAAIYYGGIAYILLITLLLGLAAWEYAQLFSAGGHQPSGVLVVFGTLAFSIQQSLNYYYDSPLLDDIAWITSILAIISITYHLIQYERGRDQAATDFAITISGILYIGLLGSYLIRLRSLPEGVWWVLTALPAVWFADSGAYFYGRVYGKHKLSPRLSPRKSWEGYIAGIIVSILGTAAFATMWRLPAGPGTEITALRGAILGVVISIIAPLGDLGQSMIKRQFDIKDSSNLIPGHGGAFDRIDSWLWASVIGFYVIVWFFL